MSTNAERFGEVVLARRLELDYTQLDLSDAGGPSNTTLTKIENGDLEDLTRATARKLDKGLRWTPGGAKALWRDGVQPTPMLEAPEGVRPQDVDDLREQIEQANIAVEVKRALLEALASAESSTA